MSLQHFSFTRTELVICVVPSNVTVCSSVLQPSCKAGCDQVSWNKTNFEGLALLQGFSFSLNLTCFLSLFSSVLFEPKSFLIHKYLVPSILPRKLPIVKNSNYPLLIVFWGFLGSSEVKASACNAGDLGLIPGSGRSPGEGNGNPLQYSCLENPMDRGAWWAAVHRVTKSWTRLSDFTSVVCFASQ